MSKAASREQPKVGAKNRTLVRFELHYPAPEANSLTTRPPGICRPTFISAAVQSVSSQLCLKGKQSHSEWPTFLTILTILQFLNFVQFLAYEVVFLYHLRNSTGRKSIFGSVRLFFRKFFFTEGSHLQFFDIFRQNGCWQIPKGPLSLFPALWDIFSIFFTKGSPIHKYFHILKSFCRFEP